MSIFQNIEIKKGLNTPLGILKTKNGYNFVFFSDSKNVQLVLSNNKETKEIPLNISDDEKIFHVEVINIPKNTLYGYKVDGNLRQDPYARSFASPTTWGEKPSKDTYLFAKVENDKEFDWENVKKPNIKSDDLIIYEMHIRGFTKDKTSDVKIPGSFLGLIEKIDYLKDLGVNAIELQPIYEFDETSYDRINPDTQKRLYNYWGYSPVSFFSIMKRYGTENDFKTFVKELHKNGIEVILDVVYNHVENPIKDKNYFLLDDKNNHLNFSGCGNTFNSNSEAGSKLILDSLIYFANEFKVDGFRFDLASILTRTDGGKVLEKPKILEMIKQEKKLKNVKLIAEPWDAASLHQLGFFENFNFLEWNDKSRDIFRKFIRGDKNLEKEFLNSIAGKNSPFKNAKSSINYVTCHDGFSLYDLVSFENKKNLSNAEENRDGNIYNFSSNSGIEGPSNDKDIEALRIRKAKNFMLALMLSKGIPMLFMGDEYLHTKNGNNNTWCQDNSLNYFLWDSKKKLFEFIKSLIKFRFDYQKFLCSIFENLSIEKDVQIKDRFLKINLHDFVVIFNSNDKEINIDLDKGNYKILLYTSESKNEIKDNKILLKSFSSIVLKKQD
ncbi:MAG: hypothetical protein KR126chlam4_00681 [Candidatus Anoxychlamydiales bacterium]|nr:hypothetical protein [Candidatus Anoxychlamydiales bacterium]NGX40850.1 hypothetical protein [Candidatus Anoxychlamydiales bacterium]